jgi:hypothetical protein
MTAAPSQSACCIADEEVTDSTLTPGVRSSREVAQRRDRKDPKYVPGAPPRQWTFAQNCAVGGLAPGICHMPIHMASREASNCRRLSQILTIPAVLVRLQAPQ